MPSNVSDTPAAVDEAAVLMALGNSVRAARVARQLPMRTVALEAGISQPFLSQIENGRTLPSLLTLYRLARALDVPVSELVPSAVAQPRIHVVRRDEGPQVPVSEAANAAVGRMLSSGDGRSTTVTEYRVHSHEDLGEHFQSDGELLVYVAEGSIQVVIEDHGEWTVGAGESISYPGGLLNSWRVVDENATILLVHSSETPAKHDRHPIDTD
ncbi:helix-turn-helix domain-containing protein [Rathayibacter sp. VKM Ac-2857]|uniref:helix-turn-helix domain-containing protein n=1 Tax=Rathayibacter sp. VKM Ac-2857 TaxID=2739020 RepID=UPI001566F24B|nr:helix-turn-helix domain-containing protein [Rathayibacter sp. VKM Ac-2857]NQX17334.1 helix-turn-helix domain-containing protein [Rathayibacter sp. VKM Ac-2857]